MGCQIHNLVCERTSKLMWTYYPEIVQAAYGPLCKADPDASCAIGLRPISMALLLCITCMYTVTSCKNILTKEIQPLSSLMRITVPEVWLY